MVSHGESGTGYARVIGELLPRLSPTFDSTLFAVNLRSHAERSVDGYRIRPNAMAGDSLGRAQLPRLLGEIQPDLVLLHHDLAFLSVHKETIASYRRCHPRTRIFAYCPIDWAEMPAAQVGQLRIADVAVCFSGFSHRIAGAVLADIPQRQRPTTAIIPHGLDLQAFARQLDRATARQICFPGFAAESDAFIVLNANRATPRKRVDLTLAAFATFAGGKNDVYLALHPTAFEPRTGIPDIAARLGITGRLLVPEPDDGPARLTDSRLAQLYAACDIGLSTTTGEAWGLVAFEHAAAGAAQVMPAHSACAELWQSAGVLCPLDASGPGIGVVDVDAVAAALNDLHANPATLAAMSLRALRRASDPALSWDAVADQWRALLDGLPHGRREHTGRVPGLHIGDGPGEQLPHQLDCLLVRVVPPGSGRNAAHQVTLWLRSAGEVPSAGASTAATAAPRLPSVGGRCPSAC